MIKTRTGVVIEILENSNNITEVMVKTSDGFTKAVNYNKITGSIKIGDTVTINTNATSLNLGTGGYDYVMSNSMNASTDFTIKNGHIIKLRYTPIQVKCLSVEEPDSPYHSILQDKDSIEGLKVIILPLHSMLLPTINILKYLDNNIRVSYVMTDSACLPIDFSKTVKSLKAQGLLDHTITSGQAFGGDFEAVNFHSALLSAKYVCESNIAIIGPGPGVVGTDTVLGFTGIEGSYLIDSINMMKGIPVYVPRISFSDSRERHHGLSHHSLTVLSKFTYSKANIGLPIFSEQKQDIVEGQLKNYKLYEKHNIEFIEENTIEILNKLNTKVNTMGRGLIQDPEFFSTVGSSAIHALHI